MARNEWSIVEEGFDPGRNLVSESLFSIGNGHMGQRANFEEAYSGESLQGSYLAGVYYPDKTRVGWWKNGYPEYFAKVLNATNWIGLDLLFDGEQLDLARCTVRSFRRELNMQAGYLRRTFVACFPSGREVRVEATRFVSIARPEVGAIRYAVTPLNFSGQLQLTLYLDGDVRNQDANYDEKFWDQAASENTAQGALLTVRTRKLDFHVCSVMAYDILQEGRQVLPTAELTSRDKYVAHTLYMPVEQGQTTVVHKYVANVTSRDHAREDLAAAGRQALAAARALGFEALLDEQARAWEQKWRESDIVIEGDAAAQQAIRFCIFQLNQTYTGHDERLNIGPKGFTGEKYGGGTYWDTEAYCLPFYLSTAEPHVARNLLLYRYRHLDQARENARKLGFSKGALYPMVTMNGEECHNEWEITFEEVHRNGAIAHAIWDYVQYTGDRAYLAEYGLEVLVEISRFWEERVHFAPAKGYVMLGVTGPNEYENNVNNNWYTNRIAAWTLEYTLEVLDQVRTSDPGRFRDLERRLQLQEAETAKWRDIIARMYYPYDEGRQVFLQQDGFLDKELMPVSALDPQHLPLNQHWSWDRILRSCFLKQADVLQGLYFLGDRYDLETKRRNFDFYEPMTVHESSLSPSVHSILACELGYRARAYELYLRASRLDLGNYNNDTQDGLHITSMGGAWMAAVKGFGGLRVSQDRLVLNPLLPDHWRSLSFQVMFRGARLRVRVDGERLDVTNETDVGADLLVRGQACHAGARETLSIPVL